MKTKKEKFYACLGFGGCGWFNCKFTRHKIFFWKKRCKQCKTYGVSQIPLSILPELMSHPEYFKHVKKSKESLGLIG